MALRKATVKKQMEGAAASVLEQGEAIQAEALCEAGPSRWWMVVSVWLVTFMIKPYYVIVTDRRVLWMKVSIWSGRPKGLLRADQRSQVAIVEHKEHPVWSNMVYRAADGSTKKIRYHRIWRDEMAAVIAQLQAPASAPAAGEGAFSG